MAKIQIILWKYDTSKDGTQPIKLRVTKNGQRLYVGLNISAKPEQWNVEFSQFKKDRRLNPEHEKLNAFLSSQIAKADTIINNFDRSNVDWTLNQFESAFLNHSKKGKIKPYLQNHIETLRDTNHIGNAICFARLLSMLEIFDDKLPQRLFSEIDIKYVRDFDTFMQKPRKSIYTSTKNKTRTVQRNGCTGNTRLVYFKALRAIINKAIQENEASQNTYPFGKGGFEVAALAETTEKRYLKTDLLEIVKNTPSADEKIEYARNLFLLSYYTFGMSFHDMAHLTYDNIKDLEGGQYIVYKRIKLINNKNTKPIQILINHIIDNIIRSIREYKKPIDNYILPIVTTPGLDSAQLYRHIVGKLKKYNARLDSLAEELKMPDVKLTSYVSRHSMAMQLQNKKASREVISQLLGHANLDTTATYLDSFETNVIDEAAKLL